MTTFVHSPTVSAFAGKRHFAAGALADVAVAIAQALREGSQKAYLVFDDTSGEVIDLDLRGSDADIVARLLASQTAVESASDDSESGGGAVRGRGRPKLGVIAREVTLLPRHWEWLGSQPGGASVVLRKLVEEAKRSQSKLDEARQRRERTYRFMAAIAGDVADFEEASRALFADDWPRFRHVTGEWPADVRDHCLRLGMPPPGPNT